MRILLSLATAITILAVALLLLLTPFWTHFALGAAGSSAPGSGGAVHANDQTIAALVTLGSFDFNDSDGMQLFTSEEQGHMRDVQVVLFAFLALAIASFLFVLVSLRRAPRDAERWRAVARGGIGLVIVLIVVGVFAFVAFDTAFLLFHEILFPGGNFSFPENSNLIRLYPEPFWELSAAALGIFASIGGLIVWSVARRRAAALKTA